MKGERATKRAISKHPKSKGTLKYGPHLAIPAAYMYSMGATDHEVAFGLGVTHPTVLYWLKVHPEFRKAKYEAGAFVEARLANAMIQVAEGARKVEIVENYDADTGTWVPCKRKVTELPPNHQAALAWLHARKPDVWQEKQQVVVEVDTETAAYLDAGRERMMKIIEGLQGDSDGDEPQGR